MAKRPTSGAKKPRRKLAQVDERRALAIPEFEKLKAWALKTLADVQAAADYAWNMNTTVGAPPATRDIRVMRNAAIVLVLLGTAARRFELCGFRCGDFKEDFNGKPRCHFEAGKGNVEADIVISLETWDIVQRWLTLKRVHGEPTGVDAPLFCGRRNEHLSVAQLHNIWVAVCETVGIPKSPVHSAVHKTRHTAGLLLLRATKSLAETSKFMRHASVAITERFYKHVLDDDVAAGLAKAGL